MHGGPNETIKLPKNYRDKEWKYPTAQIFYHNNVRSKEVRISTYNYISLNYRINVF